MNKHLPEEKSAPENLSSGIYCDLKMKLIVGDLRPAESLSIRTLAEEHGVSAMPVREALRQLASEHALIGAAKKAYRVPDLTPADAANLFYIRADLEGAAAELAAASPISADFTKLASLAKAMEESSNKLNVSKFLEANFKFHSHIYSVTDNPALGDMIETLYMQTGPWLAHGIVNLVDPDNWLGEHYEIIEALKKRNGKEARRLMEEDALWGMQLYQELS